ncbi:patatin-like phospholipase family protein [Pyxidicoccus sp. 3LG]
MSAWRPGSSLSRSWRRLRSWRPRSRWGRLLEHERAWHQALAVFAGLILVTGAGVLLAVLFGWLPPGALLVAAVNLVCGGALFGSLAFLHRSTAAAVSARRLEAGSRRAPRTRTAEQGRATGPDGRRRSLILAGGGMRVAWQAGAIRALSDAGVLFQHADGTSSGILNLAMLLSGVSPREVCDRWRTLPVKELLSFAAPRKSMDLHDVEALGDTEGLVRTVLPHLGVNAEAIRASSLMEGTFNVCDFARKTNEVFPHTRVDQDLLVAGLSPPILMPPVNRGGTLYTDALWIQDGNLMEAVRRGADVIWVLWCIGNTPDFGRGLFQQYHHLVELSANGALFEQLERVREINDRISAGEEVMGHTRPIAVHLVKPERPLPLDPDLYEGRVSAASLIDLGYSDTWRYLEVRGTQGLPLTPEITLTTEPAADLTFRESLTGLLTLGATDPMAGALHPNAEPFTVHLTVTVDDMEDFVSDIRHSARLVASVSYAPFGTDLSVRQGSFNLFRSTDDPRTRLVTYGLRFAQSGHEYYLEGTRAIRPGEGRQLWKDTTRLYCQLHDGRDARGPVVGAGVLTMGLGQLRELISSMHPARRGAAGLASMARFGKLLLGPLWERHTPLAREGMAGVPVREAEASGGPPSAL